MFVLKNRNYPEASEANFDARLNHSKQMLKNIHPMTLASFLFSNKNIYSDHTEKPTEWPTVRTSINQEERRRDKTPAQTINVKSLMTSVG